MFEALAIWYLRKKNRSVLIGYELRDDKVKSLNNKSYIYDNEINNVDYRCKDGSVFNIPKGKFHQTW